MTRLRFCIPSLAALASLSSACGTDSPTAADARDAGRDMASIDRIVMCHRGRLVEVASAAAPAHLHHGDHVARLVVDQEGIDGDGVHFTRIGDAIAEARSIRVVREEREAAACRITIAVSAGTYRGTTTATTDPSLEQLPLVIDVPDLSLEGALQMQVDGSGRATGVGDMPGLSVLTPITPLVGQGQYSPPLIFVNGQVNGYAGHGAHIQGLTLQSGRTTEGSAGGAAIVSLRVRDLVIEGNRVGGGFSESIDLRASTARVERNHLGVDGPGSGGTCDICLAGPGAYAATGNRLLAGGIPGILVVPSVLLPVPPGIEQYALPAAATVEAQLVNNEVRDHLRKPVGAGIRVGAIGVGAPNVAGTARVHARDNVLVNNTFGIIVEAAFPVANTLRRGDIDLVMAGNVVSGSCQRDMLVSLSRHTTSLGIGSLPYLLNSTFSIALGGDIAWGDVWYSHPMGFGNSLIVDGAPILNGTYAAYDAARICGS